MDQLNAGEYGFLLLTSHLGDPDRRPLTVAQLRTLFQRSDAMSRRDISRDVDVHDFVSIGYSPKEADHIVQLLRDEMVLHHYLRKGRKENCVPVTRVTPGYPLALRKRLGLDSPGCLWAKGDRTLLEKPAVSLVGSRDILEDNLAFAEALGRQAARQGLVLVSGNARGADKAAQNACLAAGGSVISVVADSLLSHRLRRNVLYLSEDGYDETFSAQRALSRNRCIHALGSCVFVAQSDLGKGGTWDGTVKNLRAGWSDVFCFRDGSEAAARLQQMGAAGVTLEDLEDIRALKSDPISFFDQ